MRLRNIKVDFHIDMPFDEPDGNGNVYTKEAIINAIAKLKTNPSVPITMTGEDNSRDVIGSVVECSDVIVDEDNKVCRTCLSGVIYHGGTDEQAEIDNGKVIEFDIMNCGLDADSGWYNG